MATTLVRPCQDAHVGLCLECDYPLHGLPETRCPECGRSFDPDNLSTMNMGRPIGRWLRWWLRPVGRLHIVLVIATALLIMVGCSAPAGYLLLLLPSVALILLLGGWWGLRLVCAFVITASRRQVPVWRAPDCRRWLIPPVVAVCTLAALVVGLPERVTFRLSRPAMTAFARTALANPDHKPSDQWIGLYPAGNIWVSARGFEFRVRASGFMDIEGFLYSPDSSPAPEHGRTYREFSGGWYASTERF